MTMGQIRLVLLLCCCVLILGGVFLNALPLKMGRVVGSTLYQSPISPLPSVEAIPIFAADYSARVAGSASLARITLILTAVVVVLGLVVWRQR